MTSGTYPQLIVAQLLFTKTHTGSKIKNTFLVHYIYIIVTDMGRGQYQDILTAQGSWSVQRPKGSLSILILHSISAFQSISRNSEGHVERVQPIICMIFILICNKLV